MTADEIRDAQLYWKDATSTRMREAGYQFGQMMYLREIAAQLAEINDHLRYMRKQDEASPTPESGR